MLSGVLGIMAFFSLLTFLKIIDIPDFISNIPYSIPFVFIIVLLLIVSLLEKKKSQIKICNSGIKMECDGISSLFPLIIFFKPLSNIHWIFFFFIIDQQYFFSIRLFFSFSSF